MLTSKTKRTPGRPGFAKDLSRAIRRGILAWACCLIFVSARSQAALEWYNSTDVGENGSYSEAFLDDWIFDIIRTQAGNYLAVGFALEGEAYTSQVIERRPSYVLYGPGGHLLEDVVVGEDLGQFVGVAEGAGYYYAVGYQEDKALLVRIGKDNLQFQAYPVTTALFTPSTSLRGARLQDVAEVECGSDKRIFSVGYATDNSGERRRWIAAFEIDGSGDVSTAHEWV
jgi:hypothetical protein